MKVRDIFRYTLIRCLLVVIVGYGAYSGLRAWERRTDGFTLEKMHSDLVNDPKWDIQISEDKTEAANEILNQPFYYLARGFQCYAFVSEDGKYVLKFMRHQRLRPPVMYDWLPQCSFIKQLKEKKTQERAKRGNYLFRCLKVAFENVPEETGLLYVHLNKTEGMHPAVTIYDKAGTRYEVALDKVEFVLQRKAVLIKPTITDLVNSGREEEARLRIDQIFALLADCAKKGIQDMDGALIRKDNLGFLPDRAIYIDAGKLTPKESIKIKERFAYDLRRLRPLRKWLAINHPELAKYFDEQKKRAVDAF